MTPSFAVLMLRRVYGANAVVAQGRRMFEVSKEVYEKVAYRGSTEGVVAEVRTRQLDA